MSDPAIDSEVHAHTDRLRALAVIRLVGALMLEENDEWSVSRRDMTLETIGALSDNQRISLPALAA